MRNQPITRKRQHILLHTFTCMVHKQTCCSRAYTCFTLDVSRGFTLDVSRGFTLHDSCGFTLYSHVVLHLTCHVVLHSMFQVVYTRCVMWFYTRHTPQWQDQSKMLHLQFIMHMPIGAQCCQDQFWQWIDLCTSVWVSVSTLLIMKKDKGCAPQVNFSMTKPPPSVTGLLFS